MSRGGSGAGAASGRQPRSVEPHPRATQDTDPERKASMHRFTYEDGARLLVSDLALPDLSPADALHIVPFMTLTLARAGAVLFRAGGPGNQYMVMLLDGDAVVEGQLTGSAEWIVLRTLVPGSLFGEMGAMDSMARGVVVRATAETCLATLDDAAMARITAEHPVLGCRLLQAILGHLTRRLRSANHKIEALNEINQALRAEWNAETKFDQTTRARLAVLMKMERQLSDNGAADASGVVDSGGTPDARDDVPTMRERA